MSESTLRVSLLGSRSGLRHSRLRIKEEINRYSPAMLLVKHGGRCAEVTAEMFFDIAAEMGHSLRNLPWEVTVPRRGWIVLVPRTPVRRTSRRTA